MIDMSTYNELIVALKNMLKSNDYDSAYYIIHNALNDYYEFLQKGDILKANKRFNKSIFKYNKKGKANINPRKDAALELLDMIYRFTLNFSINHRKELNRDVDFDNEVLRYIDLYQRFGGGNNLNLLKNNVYKDPKMVHYLLMNFNRISDHFFDSVKNGLIAASIYEYANERAKTPEEQQATRRTVELEPKNESSIVFTEVTDTARHLFSNVVVDRGKFVIMPSFNAVSNDKKVEVSSIEGKKNGQEDAVLSIQDQGFGLHVVADGVGGSDDGSFSSAYTVKKLEEWFKKIDLKALEEHLKDKSMDDQLNIIAVMINEKLQDINDEINKINYEDDKNSQTTVVLLFTTPTMGVVANVGDSTAYSVDKNDNVKLSSKIDAAPFIEKEIVNDYEKYRNHPNNNYVSACLGNGPMQPHFFGLKLDAYKKILLSSDGITDLINEKNFMNMIRGKSTAKDFTDKSLHPDSHVQLAPNYRVGTKYADNASAIVVHLDDEPKKRRR